MDGSEWEEELLTGILGCGCLDLERFGEVVSIAKKFNITIDDILGYAEEIIDGKLDFNIIMYSAMRLILEKIAENVKDEETADKIREHEVFINYMDSWFNIDALDELRDREEIEKTTREEIIEKVARYFRGD